MPGPKSLQQKMVLFLLLPVAALLAAMAWFAYTYAKDALIREWRESAILKLQRAAHEVDMRLSEPKLWMRIFGATGGEPEAGAIQEWIVQQLRNMEGVEKAALTLPNQEELSKLSMGMRGRMMFEHAEITRVTPPRLDNPGGRETISLISDLLSSTNQKVGRLVVAIRFDYLIQSAISYGWKQEEMTSLIDDQGKVLACSVPMEERRSDEVAFKAVLDEMGKASFGTIMGLAHPDRSIVGFYRLKEAPWTLVITAGDAQILGPIERFRNVFLITGALFIVVILLLIRSVAGRTVASIREVSLAAGKVAEGDYGVHLAAGSGDEVGHLIRSFNAMAAQLEERMRLKEALDLAMKVQQNLLPDKPPRVEGLDIAGTCIYCDETGGDYYDFLQFPELGEGKIAFAVGDVAGHGISAALLMTTVRAMIRTRLLQSAGLAQVTEDVNRLLCCDTERSGDFMTLFLALLDTTSRDLFWVRAGHTPAILYDWSRDFFEELKGEGVALGFDYAATFTAYRYDGWNSTRLLFMGTDGIWETENPQGEQFGTERLQAVLRQHCRSSSDRIVQAVLGALEEFRLGRSPEDDITLVVVKSK